jgi:hypothetical protein
LVINGKITNQPGPYYLELGVTKEGTTLPEPISGAVVVIYNQHGEKEAYQEVEPGKYELEADIVKGEMGVAYHIEIELPDGRVYRSLPERIPVTTAKTDVLPEPGFRKYESSSGRIIEDHVVNVYGNTQVPESSNPVYLKWSVESLYLFQEMFISPMKPQTTCYVTENISTQRINLFQKMQPESIEIERQLLAVKPFESYQFAFRHFFTVYTSSITKRRYQYWEQVDQVINQTGTIFDLIPATVKGNVINEADSTDYALGYFEASSVSISRADLLPGDFNVAIPHPCPDFEGVNNHFACYDCGLLENSTDERPDFLDNFWRSKKR